MPYREAAGRMRARTYQGAGLADFVTTEMVMASFYQPLLIKSLVESGRSEVGNGPGAAAALVGQRGADPGAADTAALAEGHACQARHRLPRQDDPGVRLAVRFKDNEQRQLVIDICDAAIAAGARRCPAGVAVLQDHRASRRAGARRAEYLTRSAQ